MDEPNATLRATFRSFRAHPLTSLRVPHDMAASYATDVGGGSHHDALLGLRDLPSFKDKYTVECVEARFRFLVSSDLRSDVPDL